MDLNYFRNQNNAVRHAFRMPLKALFTSLLYFSFLAGCQTASPQAPLGAEPSERMGVNETSPEEFEVRQSCWFTGHDYACLIGGKDLFKSSASRRRGQEIRYRGKREAMAGSVKTLLRSPAHKAAASTTGTEEQGTTSDKENPEVYLEMVLYNGSIERAVCRESKEGVAECRTLASKEWTAIKDHPTAEPESKKMNSPNKPVRKPKKT